MWQRPRRGSSSQRTILKRNCLCSVLCSSFFVLIFASGAKAQDQNNQFILPAGTLLRCTLNEPNFSSKTAEVGDPVICPLAGVLLFGHAAFPRGAYLGGHLEADKDPGHFFGKGYLKLEFDRIGLPDDELPAPGKIVAASGFRVDREGKIVGHGHATRDVVEWMLPPLWPLKVLTLPARGPRPRLRPEERLTLRLMEDVEIPVEPQAGRRSLSKYSSENSAPRNSATSNRHIAPQPPAPVDHNPPPKSTAEATTVTSASSPSSTTSGKRTSQSVIVMRNGTSYIVSSLREDAGRLNYTLTDGTAGVTKLDEVDWTKTLQSNAENGTVLALKSESGAQ